MLTSARDITEHTWHMLGVRMHGSVEAFYGSLPDEVYNHHIFQLVQIQILYAQSDFRLSQHAESLTVSIFSITLTNVGLSAASIGDIPLLMGDSWRKICSHTESSILSVCKMQTVSARCVRKWLIMFEYMHVHLASSQ